mgnify:CR=1 FL=1|tara:strand:+ start:603 stop:863 length:261 start_codon:yes stop_codon:yes gene_type:complete
MSPLEILEQFGLPIATVVAFGYFIWKQQKWIQKELVEDLDEEFARLEQIIIKLIDQQKVTQLDVKHIKGYINGIKDIIVQLEKEKR